uniref:Transthyretin-like family protein n=1 Tax=Rhabditophanes sp. KR3021 TaxID=114890 RepID=A0AC35U8X8_9BILA
MFLSLKRVNIFKSAIIVLIYITSNAWAFRTQSVGIKGILMCGDSPANNVHVKLSDKDGGPNQDDLLDSAYTDLGGSFTLSGHSSELSNIDPEIQIYHDCLDFGRPCQREWIIRIPEKYISSGRTPEKYMDLGILNLEIQLEHEDKECKH